MEPEVTIRVEQVEPTLNQHQNQHQHLRTFDSERGDGLQNKHREKQAHFLIRLHTITSQNWMRASSGYLTRTIRSSLKSVSLTDFSPLYRLATSRVYLGDLEQSRIDTSQPLY